MNKSNFEKHLVQFVGELVKEQFSPEYIINAYLAIGLLEAYYGVYLSLDEENTSIAKSITVDHLIDRLSSISGENVSKLFFSRFGKGDKAQKMLEEAIETYLDKHSRFKNFLKSTIDSVDEIPDNVFDAMSEIRSTITDFVYQLINSKSLASSLYLIDRLKKRYGVTEKDLSRIAGVPLKEVNRYSTYTEDELFLNEDNYTVLYGYLDPQNFEDALVNSKLSGAKKQQIKRYIYEFLKNEEEHLRQQKIKFRYS